MTPRTSNWPIWTGLLLSVVAMVSYPFFFVRFPITRDVPWVNLLLFAVALLLVVTGMRRAFQPGRTRRSKTAAVFGASLSALVLAFFVFGIFIFARQLPPSTGAPRVGQKVPDFQLTDSNGKTVTLAELLTTPIQGQAPKGVLLMFYRGYW